MSAPGRRRISPRAVVDQRDLFLVALIAGAAIASVALDLPAAARMVFVIPLVLFLPGYALVAALLPLLVIPAVERILLATGTSLALAVLAGLILAASPFHLTAVGWALALGIPTVVLAFVAWFRRIRRSQVGPGFSFAGLPRSRALMVMIAALVVVNVVLFSRLSAIGSESPPPVSMWMLPVADRPDSAVIGVRGGPEAGHYRVAISVAGDLVNEFTVDVQAGDVWEQQLVFGGLLREQPIVARLYEGSSTTEMRYVVLQPATNGS